MIRTEKGYGQIFKIYGVREAPSRSIQGGGARRSMCWQKRRRLMKNGQRSF